MGTHIYNQSVRSAGDNLRLVTGVQSGLNPLPMASGARSRWTV